MFLIVSVFVSRECESSLVVMSGSSEENESFIEDMFQVGLSF